MQCILVFTDVSGQHIRPIFRVQALPLKMWSLGYPEMPMLWNFPKERSSHLILILITWRIWWAPNNASRWQMGFNSAFKGLNSGGRLKSRTVQFYDVLEVRGLIFRTMQSHAVLYTFIFGAHSQNFETWLLAASFPSVCVRPSARDNSAPTGRIFMKFDIWVFFENLLRKFKLN